MSEIMQESKPQFESVKLSKMSKGYQWEIRIIAKETGISDDDLKRLQDIDDKLCAKYLGGLDD